MPSCSFFDQLYIFTDYFMTSLFVKDLNKTSLVPLTKNETQNEIKIPVEIIIDIQMLLANVLLYPKGHRN